MLNSHFDVEVADADLFGPNGEAVAPLGVGPVLLCFDEPSPPEPPPLTVAIHEPPYGDRGASDRPTAILVGHLAREGEGVAGRTVRRRRRRRHLRPVCGGRLWPRDQTIAAGV